MSRGIICTICGSADCPAVAYRLSGLAWPCDDVTSLEAGTIVDTDTPRETAAVWNAELAAIGFDGASRIVSGSVASTPHARACREAFRRVRRDVWAAREARLVAKWEGYG